MNNLIIKESLDTPAISFDATRNILELSGKSFPEDAPVFYAPVLEWLHEYLAQVDEDDEVLVNFDLCYYNSMSNRKILDIIEMLNDKAFNDAIAIDLNWIYEEDSDGVRESGEAFQEDYRAIVFNLVEKPFEEE